MFWISPFRGNVENLQRKNNTVNKFYFQIKKLESSDNDFGNANSSFISIINFNDSIIEEEDLSNFKFEILKDNKTIESGITDSDGNCSFNVNFLDSEDLVLQVSKDKWTSEKYHLKDLPISTPFVLYIQFQE